MLGSGADDYIVHFTRFDAGTAYGFAHYMAAEGRCLGVVEGTAKGLADGRAGG
ncbi:hypothetical protein D3C80_2165430 [compost metagenome]